MATETGIIPIASHPKYRQARELMAFPSPRPFPDHVIDAMERANNEALLRVTKRILEEVAK